MNDNKKSETEDKPSDVSPVESDKDRQLVEEAEGIPGYT